MNKTRNLCINNALATWAGADGPAEPSCWPYPCLPKTKYPSEVLPLSEEEPCCQLPRSQLILGPLQQLAGSCGPVQG